MERGTDKASRDYWKRWDEKQRKANSVRFLVSMTPAMAKRIETLAWRKRKLPSVYIREVLIEFLAKLTEADKAKRLERKARKQNGEAEIKSANQERVGAGDGNA